MIDTARSAVANPTFDLSPVDGVRGIRLDDWRLWVRRAQRGSAAAREELVRALVPLALRVAGRTCRRRVCLGRDDEASVAMIALNEAIDRYKPSRGKSFHRFAEMVVRNRVIDCVRLSAGRMEVPAAALTQPTPGEPVDEGVRSAEFRGALAAYEAVQAAVESREAMRRYAAILQEYGITLEVLVQACPRRVDARQLAMTIARAVVQNPRWRDHLLSRRSLPLKEIASCPALAVSQKTLERRRIYIVAIALFLLYRKVE